MVTVKDMLRCPKCGRQMMGKSHPQKWGMEYFAHCCHEFFGIDELVSKWGYDAGDLFDPEPWYAEPEWLTRMVQVVETYSKNPPNTPIVLAHQFPLPDSFEPEWYSTMERDDAYSMVNRMLLGIPEYDEYQDEQKTYYDALGIWVQ